MMPDAVATVLVTRVAVPHPRLGSWTGMFEVLLARRDQPIDYILCPSVPAERQLPCVAYQTAFDTSFPVLRRYVPSTRFLRYFNRLRTILAAHNHVVLLIVDDYNLLFALSKWLVRTGLRPRASVVFFIHGMSYFFNTEQAQTFYRSLDEIVYLTHMSYAFERSRTIEIPCEASVVWNGVDKQQFAPVDRETKRALRARAGVDPDGTCFLWLAQDRPKKGLHVVLRAWETFRHCRDNVQLVIVGANQREHIEGVKWCGFVPHAEVAPYVQMSDIYLFPSLWPEGFPLSVTEALSANLLTVASDIGPMSEVLDGGRYGYLVREPHVVDRWVTAMETQHDRFVANDHCNPFERLEHDRYSIDVWCREMTAVVQKWKRRAANRLGVTPQGLSSVATGSVRNSDRRDS
jgi:glycosyltransferase involved in cell wall biosynthesis